MNIQRGLRPKRCVRFLDGFSKVSLKIGFKCNWFVFELYEGFS